MPISTLSYTPSASYEQALARAADLFGIEREYWDIWGKHHVAGPQAVAAVLGSLGVDATSAQTIDSAVEQRLWEDWSAVAPPTVVASVTAPAIRLNLPQTYAGPVAIEIRWEDGASESAQILTEDLKPVATAKLRGQSFRRFEVTIPFPGKLGYHEMRVTAGTSNSRVRLILCPNKAFSPSRLTEGGRAGGVFVSLYGLRSRRNWGCGDFTDLKRFAEWVAGDLNASFIGLNPLHALANRQPYNTSPYLPLCSFFKNLIYLDIEAIEDFRNSASAKRAVSHPDFQACIEKLREAEFVEYEKVQRVKLRVLRALFRQFLNEYRSGSARANEFKQYMNSEGDLLDRFAIFCALDENLHRANPDVWLFRDWPAAYHDPESPETREFARVHWRSVLFYKYVQWQIEIQLADAQAYARSLGMPIGLYHDLALATDRFGADLWSHPRFYIDGCRVGAPPDDFSPAGQDWSFPPPSALEHYKDGYRLFSESIRQNVRHGGALRIDHVMRFFHLFWIPDALEAKDGIYVRDRHEDLIRILALESVRNEVIIVGEDLGTVADEIRETLAKFGILSYRLFYFERWGDGTFKLPQDYPKNALASISTHDLPTLAGFWLNRDIEARRAAGIFKTEAEFEEQVADRMREKQRILDVLFRAGGLLPDHHPRNAADIPELNGELHNAIVGFLARTPSALMLVAEEDLMKQMDQQNLPGTTEQYPNWRHKTRFTVEELREQTLPREFTRMYRGWLERTNRQPA